MKTDPKTEAAVMSVMNQLIEAFDKPDSDSGLALFAPDADVVFIGTGRDEKCVGLAEIKAEFERGKFLFKSPRGFLLEPFWTRRSDAAHFEKGQSSIRFV